MKIHQNEQMNCLASRFLLFLYIWKFAGGILQNNKNSKTTPAFTTSLRSN